MDMDKNITHFGRGNEFVLSILSLPIQKWKKEKRQEQSGKEATSQCFDFLRILIYLLALAGLNLCAR